MKNLLIYIGPEPKFGFEHEELTKIQIDNSLELGWKPEDIILMTNFPWKYRKVTALVVDGCYYADNGFNRSSKILAILKLFSLGLVKETIWFHDHDAFQLEVFGEPDLMGTDIGVTDHGWSSKWNAGSFFFTPNSEYIFQHILEKMDEDGIDEQDAFTQLLLDLVIDNYFPLNITYNLGIYQIESNLEKANKPLLVAHFHPHKPRHLNLFRNLIPKRLMDIFNKYGLK